MQVISASEVLMPIVIYLIIGTYISTISGYARILDRLIIRDVAGPSQHYRGTSIMRSSPPPRTTIGPYVWSYCRVLRGGVLLMSELPLYGHLTRSCARLIHHFDVDLWRAFNFRGASQRGSCGGAATLAANRAGFLPCHRFFNRCFDRGFAVFF